MHDPVLVGVALDDRDSGPIALAIALAGLAGGRLALVHAYPYDRTGIPVPEYGRPCARRRAPASSGSPPRSPSRSR